EPYLKGAALLGFAPQECIVVEDAPNGIRSGHAGGMRVIGLATTYAAGELNEADSVVASLEKVKASERDDGLGVDVGS
ncbi:MAG TPA: HAD-IA family hydrolase, partial [Terriglobales bacterium]